MPLGPFSVGLAHQPGHFDHPAFALLDVVEHVLLAAEAEAAPRRNLDLPGLVLWRLGHYEGTVLRTPGNGHPPESLGTGRSCAQTSPTTS
jgi:hypothetical protein